MRTLLVKVLVENKMRKGLAVKIFQMGQSGIQSVKTGQNHNSPFPE
jgi:hypothetical protein